MKISEIKVVNYLSVDEGVVTALQIEFLERSEEYVDQIITFGESMEVILESMSVSQKNVNITNYCYDLVSEINDLIIDIGENISLVEKSIPSQHNVDDIVRRRLVVLMYLRSIFNILLKESNK